MADRHKVTTVWRPSQSVLIRLEAIAEREGMTPRQLIARAVGEYLDAHDLDHQLAALAAFNRSAQLIDKVNGSAGLLREAAASSA